MAGEFLRPLLDDRLLAEGLYSCHFDALQLNTTKFVTPLNLSEYFSGKVSNPVSGKILWNVEGTLGLGLIPPPKIRRKQEPLIRYTHKK